MDRSSKKVIRAKAFCTSETCSPISRYFYLNVRFRKLFGPLLKKTMQRGDDLRAFPHCRCDAFDRARTDIANGESPALAGFRRFAIFGRSSVSLLVGSDGGWINRQVLHANSGMARLKQA